LKGEGKGQYRSKVEATKKRSSGILRGKRVLGWGVKSERPSGSFWKLEPRGNGKGNEEGKNRGDGRGVELIYQGYLVEGSASRAESSDIDAWKQIEVRGEGGRGNRSHSEKEYIIKKKKGGVL